MSRDFIRGLATGLAMGVVLALFAFQVGRAGGRVLKEREPITAAPVSVASPAPPAPAAPPPAAAPAPSQPGTVPVDANEQVTVLRQVTEQDPKNAQAWVALGNLYFDLQQPQKSVDAYARALQLKPDDPNVLTDQGVMFRALGAFDKAVANFQRAQQIDPRHLQSLFNLGIVYAYDLHESPKAEQAFNALIQMAPQSEQANDARQHLARLRGGK